MSKRALLSITVILGLLLAAPPTGQSAQRAQRSDTPVDIFIVMDFPIDPIMPADMLLQVTLGSEESEIYLYDDTTVDVVGNQILVNIYAMTQGNPGFAEYWMEIPLGTFDSGVYSYTVTQNGPTNSEPWQGSFTVYENCAEDLVPPVGVEQQDLNAVLNRWGDPMCDPLGLLYPCPEDLADPPGIEQQDLNAVLNRWGDPSCEPVGARGRGGAAALREL